MNFSFHLVFLFHSTTCILIATKWRTWERDTTEPNNGRYNVWKSNWEMGVPVGVMSEMVTSLCIVFLQGSTSQTNMSSKVSKSVRILLHLCATSSFITMSGQ